MEKEKRNNRCCLPPVGQTPWLVYTHGNGRRKKFQTFGIVSSQHYIKSIPQLRGKIIISSNDGWFILQDFDNSKMFTLWNPISSQLIHLPSLDLWEGGVSISCALVSPLDLSVFVFVEGMVFYYRPCTYNNINNNTWLSHTTEILGQWVNVRHAIICNGVIYASVRINDGGGSFSTDLVIVEVNNHGLLTLRLLGVGHPLNTRLQYCGLNHAFVASRGRVYAIGIFSKSVYLIGAVLPFVYVWELSLDLVKWDRVNCLQGRAFFVGKNNCTWCYVSNDDSISGGVKQNCVYFEPSVVEMFRMKDLCSYNLEDESWTSFLMCPNITTFSKAPTWIMLQYQRLGIDEGHKYGLGPIQRQGLQEKIKEPPQNKFPESPGALSLTFDKQKQNDPVHKFILCKLPGDLIELVAKHMHLFDYRNFVATRKKFGTIIPIAQCIANHSYPLLAFFESEKPQCTLMDPCRSDSCLMVIPEWFGGVVQMDSSKDGWLLLWNKEDISLHFFNLLTGEKGKYPPYRWDSSSIELLTVGLLTVGFSSCPTSSDCVTVGILCLERINVFYHHFEEGWIQWEFQYGSSEDRFQCSLSSPIYHKGAFYFWDARGYLGEFQLFNGQSYWEEYDKPQTPSEYTLQSSHLVECGGELLSVFIGHMGKWVRVFRFDESKMMWVRVESLGNHVLFIGTSSSVSAVAKEREMRNRIYLPIRCGSELVFYDLGTGRYSTHIGSESFENLYGMKMHVRCCWI